MTPRPLAEDPQRRHRSGVTPLRPVARWNTKGVLSHSPGLRQGRYPGTGDPEGINPNGVASRGGEFDATPLGLMLCDGANPG